MNTRKNSQITRSYSFSSISIFFQGAPTSPRFYLTEKQRIYFAKKYSHKITSLEEVRNSHKNMEKLKEKLCDFLSKKDIIENLLFTISVLKNSESNKDEAIENETLNHDLSILLKIHLTNDDYQIMYNYFNKNYFPKPIPSRSPSP